MMKQPDVDVSPPADIMTDYYSATSIIRVTFIQ